MSDQQATSTDPPVILPGQQDSSTDLSDTPPNQLGSLNVQETNHSYKSIILAVLIVLAAMVSAYYYNPTNSQTLHSKPKFEEMLYLEYSNGHESVHIIDQITPYCKKLGHMLGLRDELVQNIWDIAIPATPTDKCTTTIRKWLEGQGRTPVTWETLVVALDKLDLRELSDLLRQIFK